MMVVISLVCRQWKYLSCDFLVYLNFQVSAEATNQNLQTASFSKGDIYLLPKTHHSLPDALFPEPS